MSFKGQEIVALKSEGHSGYAESGEDIVCAAVSALVQALLVGIQDVGGFKCKIKESDAFFEVEWDLQTASKIKLLSETVILSLKGVSASYPNNVKIMEVQL